MTDVVELYAAADETEAHAIAELLRREGITARIVGGPLQAGIGGLPVGWSTAPRLWVTRHDYERAREVIERWDRERLDDQPPGTSHPWTCPGCGEKVPAGFEVCWNCGSAKNAASQ